MGQSVAENVGYAKPSDLEKVVRKKGMAKGGKAPEPTANHRRGTLEPMGFTGAPQVWHSYPNTPAAGEVERNTKWVPSVAGTHEFRSRKDYGQGV